MKEKGYEVLKMVMRLDRCYIASDYVKGVPLPVWMESHKVIPKETLFYWVREILEMLDHFHKSRGEPYYQYMNPYSIIIDRDGRLHLLDLGSAQQSHLVHLMQKRPIREHFLSPENQYYQKPSLAEDIYGLGKTIQYILAMEEISPPLTKKEEKKFRRAISRCFTQNSKKRFQTVQNVAEHLPKLKRAEKKPKKSYIILIVLCILILIAGIRMKKFPSESKTEKIDLANKESEDDVTQKDPEMWIDMGFFYFLESEEYQKAEECFAELGKKKGYGKDLAFLCKWMLEPSKYKNEKVKEHLKKMKNHSPIDVDERYYIALLKGLVQIADEELLEDKIEVGLISLDYLKEQKDEEAELEVTEILASSYEEKGDLEDARGYYEKMLEKEEDEGKRSSVFLKIADIFKQEGDLSHAIEECNLGLGENETNQDLWLLLIRIYCENPGDDPTLAPCTALEAEQRIEGFDQNEEFLKLKEEYNILNEEVVCEEESSES